MKYLAIDYGTKKCGIAVSDDRGTVAVPFKIVPTADLEFEFEHMLKNVLFERIVFGESVNNKGEHNPVFAETKKFVDKMKERYEARILNNEVKFIYEKEFMTSKHARDIDNEKNVDDRAAALILQRVLDKANLKTKEEMERQEDFEEKISDSEDL